MTAELSRNAIFPGWVPVSLPPFEMMVSVRSPIDEPWDALDRRLAGLWAAITFGVASLVYYVTLGAAVLGCPLIAHGVAEMRDESE